MYKPLKRPTTVGKRYSRKKIVRDWLHYAVWHVRLAKVQPKPYSVLETMALVIKVDNLTFKLRSSSNKDCIRAEIDGYTFEQTANGSVRHLIEQAAISQFDYEKIEAQSFS